MLLVSIPKRVSEVLKRYFSCIWQTGDQVSIPKRVSEVLKQVNDLSTDTKAIGFQSLKGFQRF